MFQNSNNLGQLIGTVFQLQAADVNGDKKLDRKEYVAFSHPEDNPHIMRTPVIQSVMKSKDKNHDGKLEFQEFIGDRGKDQDKVRMINFEQNASYSLLKTNCEEKYYVVTLIQHKHSF